MHARNGPERFPFQSGCKSTHFTRNIQTLYTIFWDFFNTPTANNWKTADYTNKKQQTKTLRVFGLHLYLYLIYYNSPLISITIVTRSGNN